MARLDADRVAAWRGLQGIVGELERLVDNDLRAEWQVPLGLFDVLAALQRNGGTMRPSVLAADIRVLRPSLSRRLDRLGEEGWVARRRTPMPDDHRAVTVELTGRGRALWRDMNVTYRRSVQEHVAGRLDDDDVADLHRLLRLLEP